MSSEMYSNIRFTLNSSHTSNPRSSIFSSLTAHALDLSLPHIQAPRETSSCATLATLSTDRTDKIQYPMLVRTRNANGFQKFFRTLDTFPKVSTKKEDQNSKQTQKKQSTRVSIEAER